MTNENGSGAKLGENGHDYPLRESAAGWLHAANGRPLSEITTEALQGGGLAIDDLQISAETLRAQAAIARRAGYERLGANLARAAELTAVPNAEVLSIYEQLRPGRASFAELEALAADLEEKYTAPECARLVRNAAAVYQARGLLRR